MLTGPILVHLWDSKMIFSSFQMPPKQKPVKKKFFNRKFFWGVIKGIIYIARLIVKLLGSDDFDNPSNSI